MRYNFAADSFYIMKLCSRLLVLYCRNCPKDDKFWYFIPIFKFLLSVIELLFLSVAAEALQGKMCQKSLLSGEGRSLGAKISDEGVVPGEFFLVSTKLDTFCYLTVQTAPCYVLSL